MQELKVQLLEVIKRSPYIESFRFSLKEKVEFAPGQYAQLIFDEKNRSNQELNKYLSFSSSPTKDYIEFTKRMSESSFSQALKNLKKGDEMLIQGPLGNCIFKHEYKRIGFLIGGIGITPVISIIEYIADKHLDNDVLLLYSNRTDEDIAFKNELDRWQEENKNIKVFFVVTDCQPKDVTCIYGVINQELLVEKMREVKKRVFFIFGPPKMVEAMNDLCLGLGCDKERVKIENFIGY